MNEKAKQVWIRCESDLDQEMAAAKDWLSDQWENEREALMAFSIRMVDGPDSIRSMEDGQLDVLSKLAHLQLCQLVDQSIRDDVEHQEST